MKKIVLMAVVLVGICAFAVYMKKKLERKQSVVLAAYSYPSADSEYWKAVIKEGGKNIPYVIINPNSGPGEETDSNYARQLKENIVVANPGRQITDKLAPYADVFVTSEITADKYINRFTEPESEFENDEDNSSHIWHIVYAAKPAQYEEIIKFSKKRNAGWIMVTNGVQPNSYDKLPEDFERIVRTVSGKKH